MPPGRPRKSIRELKLSGRWAAMPLDEKFKRFREDALTDDQRDRLLDVMRAEACASTPMTSCCAH